ncbi:hyalin-like [Strongylocentrotus purpuratus]|uniref:Uncharacterized protein n=1 Tax=Strongylocentrotus purpuratus TaxID=7668 RepID=A0A7M7NUP2_STRPU|nr:hyalin-like [Strongylocentrotus purpuratus]
MSDHIVIMSPQINVDEVTPTTATLSWTAVPGATGYQINLTGQDGSQSTVSSATESMTLSNLLPGFSYDARVVANLAGQGGQLEVGTTTFTTSQSNSVTVNNITPSTASLSWTALTENTVYQIIYTGPDGIERTIASRTNSASLSNLVPGFMYTFRVQADIGTTTFVVGTATTNTGYRIIYTNTGPGGLERTVPSGTNSVTLSGLSAGAFYDVRVEAITSTGTTVVVGTTLVNTDTLPFVFVRDVTATTASVSWMTIPGNPTYLVFYTGPNGLPQTVVSSSDSADLTGLTPGSAYNVIVRANLPDGMGTNEIGTVTFNTDPLVSSPAPRDVYFQSHELDFFTVSWEPGDITDVTGYLVAYTAGSSGFQRSVNDPTTTTITVQDDTLAGNPPTGVLVVPFLGGKIDTNYLVSAEDPPLSALPLAPTSATVQSTSATSYELRWATTPGVDGYVISYATASGDGISSREVAMGRTSEQITGLSPNTDYTFNLYSQRNGLRTRAALTILPPGSPDTTPPSVICPVDINELVEIGTAFAEISVPQPTVTDESGTVVLVSSTLPTTNQFPLGQTPVTFTYRDSALNQASCTFTVTVSSFDSMPPVVTCPSDIVNTIAAGLPGVSIPFASATVTDNSGSFVLVSVIPPSGSTFLVGTTPVTYTYRDPSGNQGSCTFSITISIGSPATNVMVDLVTQDSITLSWPVVPSNLIYQIVYIDPSGSLSQTTSTTETATLTNLLEGTTYNITVLSFTSTGQVEVGTVIATTSSPRQFNWGP